MNMVQDNGYSVVEFLDEDYASRISVAPNLWIKSYNADIAICFWPDDYLTDKRITLIS